MKLTKTGFSESILVVCLPKLGEEGSGSAGHLEAQTLLFKVKH